MIRKILSAVFSVLVLSSAGYGAVKPGVIVFDDKAESLKKAGVAPAVFSHATHENTYKCEDCHPKVFKDKRGVNDITMQKNISGEFCGTAECHDGQNSKAFPLLHCTKCHIQKK